MKALRARLLIANGVTLLLALLTFGVLASVLARAALEQALFTRLTAVAAATAAPITHTSAAGRLARLAPDSERTRANFDEQLRAVQIETGVRRVRIVNAGLETLTDTAPTAPFAIAYDLQLDRTEIGRVFAGEPARWSVLFYNDAGEPILRGYAPVRVDGDVIATVAVDGDADFLALLGRLQLALAAAGLGALVAMGLVTLWQTRRIVAPIETLVAAIRRIAEGQYEAPIEAGSDLRETEILAEAVEQMRQALLRREEDHQMLVAGVAHEIRNPIGGMELFLGLLREELPPGPAASHAERLRHELDHLTFVVNRFLAWARRTQVVCAPVAVEEVVSEVLQSLEPLRTHHQVVVSYAAHASDCWAAADAALFRGALHNVVQNAIQASPPGQEVVVEVDATAGRVRVTVADHGPGMSETGVRDAFRPFWTSREKGTGLGLPLARRHMELQGGSLVLQSREGEGTVVTLTLPACAPASGGPPQSAGPAVDSSPSPETQSRPAPPDLDDGDTLIG